MKTNGLPPVNQAQCEEWDRFLDHVPRDQQGYARSAMLGYCIGDIPRDVFDKAMATLQTTFPATEPAS